mmetsp:Transcript_73954/g.239056  ORF Transcript_73954/g.239056 Transcript_73954/m.239056 type:complete len:206 (-) Transcript_73954:193-810(-)
MCVCRLTFARNSSLPVPQPTRSGVTLCSSSMKPMTKTVVVSGATPSMARTCGTWAARKNSRSLQRPCSTRAARQVLACSARAPSSSSGKSSCSSESTRQLLSTPVALPTSQPFGSFLWSACSTRPSAPLPAAAAGAAPAPALLHAPPAAAPAELDDAEPDAPEPSKNAAGNARPSSFRRTVSMYGGIRTHCRNSLGSVKVMPFTA